MFYKTSNPIISFLSKRFKILWATFSVVALFLVYFSTLKYTEDHLNHQILSVVKDTSNQLDGFIEDLFQEVYTLPLYGKNITQCTNSLHAALERIVINNSNISALVITDKKRQIICSTVSQLNIRIPNSAHARNLYGPFNIPFFDQPVFLVNQVIGPYTIDIFIVASVLKHQIETSNSLSSSVTIYDRIKKLAIFHISHSDDNQHWIVSAKKNQQDLDKSNHHIDDKLQSIDSLELQITPNNLKLLSDLKLNLFIAESCAALALYFLYILIKYLTGDYYSLNRQLKFALKSKQFYPEFQPIYDVLNHRYSGVELLLRWRTQDGKEIMPDIFIKEAEFNGLIIPITIQIISIAFKEFNKLLKEYPYLYLSINIAAKHFKDPYFFSTFERIRIENGISTQQIIFEVTERELIDKHNNLFLNSMKLLRNQGYSLAIDDFGTGHANLSYLQNFPFNYLKIDKIFVQSIGTKAINESLIDTIIELAKKLGLVVIAEGVETKEQYDFLKSNEVHYIQGWYFSKALPFKAVKHILQGLNHE